MDETLRTSRPGDLADGPVGGTGEGTAEFEATVAGYGGRRRTGFVQRTLRDSAYLLTALPIGIAAFVVAVTGMAAGAGLFVVWVGLPVLVGTVLVCRGLAQLERLRLRSLQDRPAPLPTYKKAEPGDSAMRRLLTPLRDPQSWLDVLWSVVAFVTGIFGFLMTVGWWAAAGGGLTYWFWERWIPEDGDVTTLPELLGYDDSRTTEIWWCFGIGVFALLTLPLVLRAVAALHAGTSRALLDGREVVRAHQADAG